jgi:hypothetical protein
MTASLLHPDRYGPVLRDAHSEWTGLLIPVFRDLGMTEARARTEVGLLVDASFGLLIAALADDDWDRADAAFHTLLDRLEPGRHDT